MPPPPAAARGGRAPGRRRRRGSPPTACRPARTRSPRRSTSTDRWPSDDRAQRHQRVGRRHVCASESPASGCRWSSAKRSTGRTRPVPTAAVRIRNAAPRMTARRIRTPYAVATVAGADRVYRRGDPVAELVDAPGLNPGGLRAVWVRVPPGSCRRGAPASRGSRSAARRGGSCSPGCPRSGRLAR